MPPNVYGPEADEEYAPVQDTDVGQNTPAGNPTDPRSHDVAANDPSDPRGERPLDKLRHSEAGKLLANKATDAVGKAKPEAGSILQALEVLAQPDEFEDGETGGQNNFSFINDVSDLKGQSPRSLLNKVGRGVARRYTKYYLITGVIGGIISLFVTAFLILIPLKIESIVTDLESHFMSAATSATQRESDNLFSNYMTGHVFPALKACGARSTAVIDKHCNAYLNNTLTGGTSNPVHALYRGWRNANLENKLATKYGIEFQYDRSANGRRGEWYLKTPTTSGKGVAIGADGKGLSGEFQKASRADMRAAFNDATSWYNVMRRYKVGRLLEEKYGIKRCVVFCGTRDAFANAKVQAKYAAKMFIIDRVTGPHMAAISSVLGCILVPTSSNGCDGKAPTTCTESTCDELAGETEDVATANVEQAIGEASSGFGSETADSLIKLIGDVRREGGAQTYIVNKVINKFTTQETDQNAVDDVPLVGELSMVNQGLAFVNEAGGAGNKLQDYSYLVNSAAAVSLFAGLYEVYADEIHTGHVTATEVGSFTNSLGPGNQCQPEIEKCSGPPVNGTAEAENTPLYSSLIEGDPSPGQSKTYLCNNNQPVPKGKLVCPEENLGAKNQTLSSIDSALSSTGVLAIANAYEKSPVAFALNKIQSAINYVTSVFVTAAEGLFNILAPGLYSEAKNAAASILKGVVNDFIPNIISPDESGGRTFDMMTAGADVSGNDFAHTGLGGQKLTPTQAASITQQQENEAQKEFQTQPLFARLFSTNTPYSLISKVAVDVPFGVSTSIQDGFASLLNPLSALSSSFGSLLSGKSDAAALPGPDPFGVTQYGYPDPNAIPSDPETYWNNNCSDNAAQGYQKTLTQAQINAGDKYWNDETTTDPDNGQQDNTTVNPCMLIKSTVGSTGATSDSSLLTSDDTADLNQGSSGTPSSGSGSYQDPFRDIEKAKALTTTRVDEGVDYAGTGTVYAIGDGTITEIANDNGTSEWWGAYGGDSVVYKLSDGPAAGKSVYVAEHCPPMPNLSVNPPNNQVTSSTPLCTMQPASIETGWAVGDGTDKPAAYSVYTESSATAYGQNFEELMDSLGVSPKACYDHTNQTLQGALPSGWPTWVPNPATTSGPNQCP